MNKYGQVDEKIERIINGEYTVSCDRCGGEGYISRYRHIEHGICFKCRGAGHLVYRRFKKVA